MTQPDPSQDPDRPLKILVITLSDRASNGEYSDRSGPMVEQLLKEFFASRNRDIHISDIIIPDNANQLQSLVRKAATDKTDIVITTGGTGVGPRDITVDTIKPMLTVEIPGIMDMIRLQYGAIKPNALLSRSVAGFIDNTLIYTLPGSVKAVHEYMEEILKTMEHLIDMRRGLDTH